MRTAVPLAALVLAAGCAAPSDPSPPQPGFESASYPGVLRPPSSLGEDVLWRQRVTATWGDDGRRSFDAAVQVSGGALTVLGISPLGVGFVLKLEGGEVSFENRTDRELPFPPRFVLLDVQRVFYPWLPPGTDRGDVDGEEVVERRSPDGRLLERRFRRLDGDPPGEIVVRYEGYAEGRRAPGRAVLENGWFGYWLIVETHEERKIGEESKGEQGRAGESKGEQGRGRSRGAVAVSSGSCVGEWGRSLARRADEDVGPPRQRP